MNITNRKYRQYRIYLRYKLTNLHIMKSLNCPECESSEVVRIGLYDYQCEICGEVFDVIEGVRNTDDWFPKDDDFEDELN